MSDRLVTKESSPAVEEQSLPNCRLSELRVLLMVADPLTQRHAARILSAECEELIVSHVPPGTGFSGVDGDWDMVILDSQRPWSRGMDQARQAKARWPECLALMLTLLGEEHLAVEAMGAGIDGYMSRDAHELVRLRAGVRRLRERRRLKAAQRESQQVLCEALEMSQSYLDVVPVMVVAFDAAGVVKLANQAACQMLGCSEAELLGTPWIDTFVPEAEREGVRVAFADVVSGVEHTSSQRENRIITRSGEERLILWCNTVLRAASGEPAGVLSAGQDVTESRRVEAALRESESLYKTFTESIGDAVDVKDSEGRYVLVNSAMLKVLRRELSEVIGRTSLEVTGGIAGSVIYGQDMQVLTTGEVFDAEDTRRGGVLWVRKVPLRDEDDQVIGIVTMLRDITERRQLERQFREAQKMEAVGRLSAGIAHDFNNLLTVINGYADMLLSDRSSSDEDMAELTEIRSAGRRAAELTRQLLTFSRQRVTEPRPMEINSAVRDLTVMLERLIGEDVALSVELGAGAGSIVADVSQIEQVVMNLAVNARDAMPDGGTLEVGTRVVKLDEGFCGRHPEMAPGPHVCLSIRDTGQGMDEQVLSHLFEPFFTTKEVGKGTGLGLSIVWGIVRECQGCIEVESEPGSGSEFSLYFPRAKNAPQAETDTVGPLVGGHETILLVEDQDAVRNLTERILSNHGYRVIAANRGGKALEVCRDADRAIDLVLTDVVMPELGGRALGEELRRLRPGLPVIYMSGYSDRAAELQHASADGLGVLQKPFTPQALLDRIRRVLDARLKENV